MPTVKWRGHREGSERIIVQLVRIERVKNKSRELYKPSDFRVQQREARGWVKKQQQQSRVGAVSEAAAKTELVIVEQ